MLKLSYKFKIIAAVLAVAIVAGAAIAYVAVSTNAGNDKSDLLAGGGTVTPTEPRIDDYGVSITRTDFDYNEFPWTINSNETAVIGTYECLWGDESEIISSVEVDGHSITNVTVQGERFNGETIEQTDIYVDTLMWDITLTQAGKYEAVVELDNGNSVTFYAQINQAELSNLSYEDEIFGQPTDNREYNGYPLFESPGVELSIDEYDVDFGAVLDIDVTGFYHDGTTPITTGIEDDEIYDYGGYFNVTEAGNYSIAATIVDPNYKWADETDVAATTKTLSFTVKQAYVTGHFELGDDYGDDIYYSPDDDGVMDKSALDKMVQFVPSKGAQNYYELAGVIEYYADLSCTDKLTTFGVGTVYAKVVGIKNADDDGDTTYLNYRLPEPDEVDGPSAYNGIFRKTITIKPIALNKPGLSYAYLQTLPEFEKAVLSIDNAATAVSTPYLGFYYQIWHFFNNDDMWAKSYDSGEHWIVTLDGVEVNPNDNITSMCDVKRGANGQVLSYEIAVTPKENYGWVGDDPYHTYVYHIAINPSVLTINDIAWNIDITYNGDLLNDGTPITLDDIKYTITAPGCEHMKLDLEFDSYNRTPITDGEGNITGYEPIVNAGSYRVNIKGMTGEGSGNYTLSTGLDNYDFVVKRQALDLAKDLGTLIELDFNGDTQRFEKEFVDRMIELGLAVYNPTNRNYISLLMLNQNGATVSPYEDGRDGVAAEDFSLYFGGWFQAKYAGYYTLEFSFNTEIGATSNFCWIGENGAPNGERGSYTWRNFAYIAPASVNPSLGSDQTISVDADYIDMANKFDVYVNGGETPVYTIKGYVDVKNGIVSDKPVDKDANGKYIEGDYYILLEVTKGFYPNSFKFEAGSGVELVEVDGTQQAKVYYSVRSGVANIRLEVTNYTFGDNFSSSWSIENIVTIFHNMGNDATYTASYKVLTKDLRELDSSELANGTPRNAGEYYIEVTVTFDGVETPCVERALLTVSKKNVALTWKVDGIETALTTYNLTYNKSNHAVTVDFNVIDGTDLTIALSNASGLVNADTYAFNTDSLIIGGADKDNYVLSNVSFTLVIKPIEITVTARSHSITYGESLSLADFNYDLTGAFLSGDFNNEIIVKVFDKDGNYEITDLNNLGKGTYTLLPVWDGEQPTNYKLIMKSATLNVIAQTLEITFKSGNSSEYGDPIDLYASPICSASPSFASVDDFKAEVEILLLDKNGAVVALSDRLAAGEYTLAARLKDDNADYSLHFNEGVKYQVTLRNITVRARSIEHPYGDSYGYKDFVEVLRGSILEGDTSITFSAEILDDSFNVVLNVIFNKDVGKYTHWLKIGSRLPNAVFTSDYYEQDAGNYHVRVEKGSFTIVPRQLTLTFTNAGTSEYGDEINLFAQEENLEGDDLRLRYIVCVLSGLSSQDKTTTLKDVATLYLVDKDTKQEVCGSINAGTVGAGTYLFKAVLNSTNYTFAGGVTEDGKVVLYSQVGAGEYTVTRRDISVTLNPSATTNVYGTALTMSGNYSVVSGSIVNGDTLGVLAVYDGTKLIDDIAALDAGDYAIGLADENQNYNITYAKVDFKVTPRNVSITPDAVTNFTYGDSLTADTLKYSGNNFVSESHIAALGITAQVYYNGNPVANSDVSSLAISKDGRAYEIRLSYANGNENYYIECKTASFVINPRPITITALDVQHKFGEALEDGEIGYTVSSGIIVNDDVNNGRLNIQVQVYDGDTPIANEAISTLAVKDYTIKVSYSGDKAENYTITTQNATFSVSRLELEITLVAGASSVYGDLLNLSQAYTLSIDNVSVTVKIDGKVIDATDILPAGDHTLTIEVNPNYEVSYTNGVESVIYTITPRQITLTANSVEHTYGNALNSSLFGFTAARVGGDGPAFIGSDTIAVTYAVHDTNGEIAQDNISKLTVDGSYTVKLTYTANSNYEVTNVIDGKFKVTPRTLTVTFIAANPSHSTYFDSTSTVEATLYGSTVITISGNVNGDTIRNILSLTAVNGSGVNATNDKAPAGNYTITPNVINQNYVLADATVKGTYVIGVASIQLTSGATRASYPYTGAAQALTVPTYSTVDNCAYTVQYVLVANTSEPVSKDSVDWSKAQTAMPTVINVSSNMVCILCTAPNHADSYISIGLDITPVTLTVTANDITLTYNDAFPEMLQYTYTVTPDYPQAGAEYAGLTTVNEYLSKLAYTTNYVKGATNAGASNVTVTPVYDEATTDNNVTVKVVAGSVTVNYAKITGITVASGHASGKYTGEAYELFKDLSATVVNNQKITWWYYHNNEWKVYDLANPVTVTNACNETYKVKVRADNHDDSDEITISFVIEQNEITITADNKEIVYGNTLDTIEFTNKLSYAADNNTHLTSAMEEYYLGRVSYSVAYNTTTGVGDVAIEVTCAGDDNVKVNVVNGTLTVKQREITIEFVVNEYNNESIYGDEISADVLDTLYTKSADLSNEDKLIVTALYGTHNLLDTNAPAGSYTVKVAVEEQLEKNYDIKYVGASSGTYTIKPRTLTVTLPVNSMPFEEVNPSAPANNGKPRNAVPEFTNNVSGETVKFTATYTKGGTAVSGAPTQAGEYVVTFTLNDTNYTFANGTSQDFTFTVTKLAIFESNLGWSDQMPTYVDGVPNTNVIEAYNGLLMRVVSFTKTTASDDEDHAPIYEQGAPGYDPNNYYYFQDGKLYAYVLGRAKYEVTIELTADAAVNYQLYSTTNEEVTSVKVSFHVANINVTLTISVQGWQYTDTPTLDDNIRVAVNGAEPLYGLKYYIAKFLGTDAEWNALMAKRAQAGFDGFAPEEFAEGMLSALTELDFSDDEKEQATLALLSAYAVGRYMIYAQYDGVVQDKDNPNLADFIKVEKLDLLQISKKVISAPVIADSVYNGQEQSPTDITVITNGVDMSSHVTIRAIYRTSAGSYNVTFTINDYESYCFKVNGVETDRITNVSWEITEDKANNNDHKYFEVGTITSKEYDGKEIAVTNPAIKLEGYNGTFTWYFALKGNTSSAADVAASAWTANKPVNAGDYWVKVVLSDYNGNFSDKIDYSELTITKKQLTLTPSGTITYGEKFLDKVSEYTNSYVGFVYGDNESVVTGAVTYLLVDGSNGDKLDANAAGYALTVDVDGNGHVKGLTAANYYIVVAEGRLIVNQLAVTVTIGNVTRQYGLARDLSAVTVTTDNELADSEIVAEIKANLTASVDAATVVGKYAITSNCTDTNYAVTYANNGGTYEVIARKVYVTLDGSNAGGTYRDVEIGKVTTLSILDDTNADLTAFIYGKWTLTVVYNGTANNGYKYNNSEEVPSLAGVDYSATVIGSDNDNFELMEVTTVYFNVAKFVVDVSNITAETEMYTGLTIEPVYNDSVYNINDETIYTPDYSALSLINAGTYNIPLNLVDSFNYEWKDGKHTVEFRIAAADIYAIPSGSIVYGQKFSDCDLIANLKFVYANSGEEVPANQITIDRRLVKFILVDEQANNLNPDRLAHGTYRLTLDTANGFVIGITCESNHNVALQKDDDKQVVYGEFKVAKREITITADSSWSVYSQQINLARSFTLTEGEYVPGDDYKVITYDPYIVDGSVSKVGTYDVDAKATAANYDVKVLYGKHEIKPIEVELTLSATDGTYGHNDAEVFASGIKANNIDGYNFASDFASKLIWSITGVDYASADIPVNAGTYNVTVEGIDDDNFKLVKVTDTQLVIGKATLTLTPSGAITYGQSFTQDCTYELTGFIGTDDTSVVKGYVRYLLVNYSDDAKLQASEQGYDLAVAVDGDYVEGLSAANYNIVLAVGKLIVNKRDITLVAGDSSSIYTMDVVVSREFTLKEGNSFAWNDGKDVIVNYVAKTEANSRSSVGDYAVTATASAANYNVTVDPGNHKIMPITVGVVIRSTDGEYDNPNKIGSVRFIETVTTNLGDEPKPIDGLKFVLKYNGTAYNNTVISDSDTIPTLAGLYTVTVVGVEDTNYTIDRAYGIHTITIEVAKKAINPREIVAQNATYTGKPIIPTIIDTRYNVDGKEVYTVGYGDYTNGFTEVGSNYRLILTLTDTNNYCWLDNLNATQEISFAVDKADNAIVDSNGNVLPNGKIEISGWTVDDTPNKPQVKLANGSEQDIVFEYASSIDGRYSSVVPTTAGTYWVRAYMAESNNYHAYTSAPVSFVIAKRTVTVPTATNMADNNVYTGEMLSLEIANFDDRVMSLECDLFTRNADGKLTLSALNAGEYRATITLRDASSYAWADESAATNGKIVIVWKVERQVLKVIVSDGRKIVVTGDDIVFIPDGFNSGIMTIRDNVRAHEGKYSAVITLKDKANYAWEGIDGDTITVEFEIVGTNTIYVALICVASGLCVGLAVMAVIMTLVHRRKKRKQDEAIDARSRADGWEE